MKQQLKRLVAAQITALQADVRLLRSEVAFFERRSNKDDPGTAPAFQSLNRNKQALRKAQRKLRKLTKLQHEIKSMVGYITAETGVAITNVGKV